MRRLVFMAFSAGITLLAVAAMLASARLGGHFSGIFKMIASTGFIGMAVASGGGYTSFGQIIMIGLFFSWWGDLCLVSATERVFLLGVGAFFLAHVAYGAAFLWAGVDLKWTAIAAAMLVPPSLVVLRWLYPHLGDMRLPVVAYIVVITLMVALAVGASKGQQQWIWLAGAALFYLSDLFVARDRFVAPSSYNKLFGLPLYYAAQLVIAFAAGWSR